MSGLDRAVAGAAAALPHLLSHLWESTIFLAVALLVAWAARRRLTASARFAIVFVGLLKLAIPARLIGRLLTPEQPWPEAVTGALPARLLVGPPTFADGGAPASAWPAAAICTWLVVALGLLSHRALQRHRLVALAVRTATPPIAREAAALERARRRLGLRKSVDLARAPVPEAPAVLRIVRPLVVLPPGGCEQLSDDELTSLFQHECAHVARHDNLLARLESAIGALFWFHPLAWIARRRLQVERERACDEAAAGSAEERDRFLAALSKFCHAAIAPQLPGVSCVATATLKGRMEYAMEYLTLRKRAVAPGTVRWMAGALLVVWVAAAGTLAVAPVLAKDAADPFAIRTNAVRRGSAVVVSVSLSDNSNGGALGTHEVVVPTGESATLQTLSGGKEITLEVGPEADGLMPIVVEINDDGGLLLRKSTGARIDDGEPSVAAPRYSGEPINISLVDATLSDVLATFGKISGLRMQVAEDVTGTVTVHWENVPWDQAFDELLRDHGLTYRVEGSVIHVTRR